jgi:CHAT domain-containing protein/Flp pilus assembly protein TadD
MRASELVRLRAVGLLGLLAGLLAQASRMAADEPPPKPPWQRMLQGENANRAEQLQARISMLVGAGKYADAIEPAKELTALRERVQGGDHWETVDARLQVRTLKQVAALNGPQQADYQRAHTASRQAEQLEAKGGFAEAQPLREQALDLCARLLGDSFPDTASGYDGLASNLYAQRKFAEAEKQFRKALDLRRELLNDHPLTAQSYGSLADCLDDRNKLAEAEEHYRKALALCRELLGEHHLNTAQCYGNLGYILNRQGKYREAEKSNRAALTLKRQLLGDEHRETAASYNNLASNLQHLGRYAEAEAADRTALALRRKVLGEEDLDTAQSYNNLATTLDEQGRFAEAEEGHRKALALYVKLLGEKDPLTATGYNQMGYNLYGQRRYPEADENYRKSLELCLALLGEDHPDTAQTYCNLAVNLNAQGKFAEAEEALRVVLKRRRRLLGDEHPDTAQSYYNLAGNLLAQGKYPEAEKDYRTALAVYRKLMGQDHPVTALAGFHLATTLAAQRRDREAEEQLSIAADAFTHVRPGIAAAGLERTGRGDWSPLPSLAATLARQGKAELAWQRFEQSLGRGTWDDVTARLARSPREQALLTELARRLERLDLVAQQYGALKQPTEEQSRAHKERLTERRRTQEQLDALTRELAEKYGVAEAQAYQTEKVQAALPADTALLGWVDYEVSGKAAQDVNERWAVLLRARGKPVWVRLKGSGKEDAWTEADSRLPAELATVLQTRPRPEQTDHRPLARRLYRQRLEPLESQLAATADLPAVRHLIVLPSRLMDGIPLEALTDLYTFSRAPSATVFAFLRGKPKPQTDGLLALADPVFEHPDAAAKPAPLPPGGVLLVAVLPGSNAAQAGLHSGDVLLLYKDTALKNAADLGTQIQAAAADAKGRIPIEVWREGEKETLKMEVPPGPLGVSVAKEPAPEALAKRRRIDADVAASRGDGDWKALPGTRAEAEAIARHFRDAQKAVTLLTDSDASEQRLAELAGDGSLGKVRYLHLATHGTVNRDFPLQSSIILSRDRLPDPAKQLDAGLPVYDGRLTAAEVLRDWNLDADLVTLSACETGLGHYAHGEGYMGFAQALLIAGSRSVCLSLWPVDDAATALLMDRFYANLLGRREGLKAPLGKAEALDDAKKWLRTLPRKEAVKLAAKLTGGVERGKGRPALPKAPPVPETATEDEPPYAHPYYWAAFVLIGDTD